VKHVLKAFPQAAAQTARSMTYELRQSALDHGWDPKVASKLFIVHNGSEFKLHVPARHKAKVYDLEYGTQSTPPSAVIRKFNNRPQSMEKALLSNLAKLTKGKL